MNILCLDYGGRNVGYATGNVKMKIAFPQGVILNKGLDVLVEEVKRLSEQFAAEKVVVGLPLKLEGVERENRIVKEVRKFVDLLSDGVDFSVELYDERFSSFEADELMGDVDRKSQLPQDAYAAQVILQRFFDEKEA